MAEYPFFNRELSWIEFNNRVLQEALKPHIPLLERLKFLSIVSSNLDEFFMVRVAAVKSAIRRNELSFDVTGITPTALLDQISERVKKIHSVQYTYLMKEIWPSLVKAGLEITSPADWSPHETRFLESYFSENIFVLLTPLRIEEDSFPSVGNLQIHCAFELEAEDGAQRFAITQVPRNTTRFIRLPAEEQTPAANENGIQKIRIALLEDVILRFAARLFPGNRVRSSLVFKVTRDADSGVDEDRQEDFLAAMEEVLAERHNSTPVRLTISGKSPILSAILKKGLELGEPDTYHLPGPIDLGGFHELAAEISSLITQEPMISQLLDKPWPPIQLHEASETSIWEEIESKDILLHVPYESFDTVSRFIEEAATDPDVLSIKMTLYRTSGDSPIIKSLIKAARNRKQVAVVVELKARFDEERNITWASSLEQAGAIVTYGVARLKVHAKAALVVRKGKDGSIRKYLHLSTGNYNDRTAKLYSDFSLFTVNEDLCREASFFFNMLTGYSSVQTLSVMAIAPFDMKKRLLALIDREIQRSTAEAPGLIFAKLNALADPEIIEALYTASQAGVRIQLNVRGICALIPGLPGLSETIEVRSILGRYLEHGRMIYFANGGTEEIYLSSADWLPRNMDRRIELMFPIFDENIRKTCKEILWTYFKDTSHAYRLLPSGAWEAIKPEGHEKPAGAQEMLYHRVRKLARAIQTPQEQLTVRRRFRSAR